MFTRALFQTIYQSSAHPWYLMSPEIYKHWTNTTANVVCSQTVMTSWVWWQGGSNNENKEFVLLTAFISIQWAKTILTSAVSSLHADNFKCFLFQLLFWILLYCNYFSLIDVIYYLINRHCSIFHTCPPPLNELLYSFL